jgi:fructokinase
VAVSEKTRPILSIGEAIVDLICERNLLPDEAPDAFVPHQGGAPANVAAAVAARGTPSALLGGVGQDPWGEWLVDGLEAAGVDSRWLARLEGALTPIAVATFNHHGEPSFLVYGEDVGPMMRAAADRLEEAIASSQAVILGSNTMVGSAEREVTRTAVRLALEAGVPVMLDPNHRPTRWIDQRTAVEFGLELAASATVVKCNVAEARLLTGESGRDRAAAALASLGPDLVVVTDGPHEVVTAGAATATDAPPGIPAAEMVSELGAGDAFMGSLASGLAGLGWDLARVGEVLPRASADAAACCRTWGARA